jgi:hypothetical protein
LGGGGAGGKRDDASLDGPSAAPDSSGITRGSAGRGEEAAFILPGDVAAIEIDVLDVCGELGIEVLGDVEQAGVVSAVTEDEVRSCSLEAHSACAGSGSGGLGSSSSFDSTIFGLGGEGIGRVGVCFGEAGGVGMSNAC